VAAANDTIFLFSMNPETGEMKREAEFKADFCTE